MRRAAFTLVEIVLALGIISFVMVAIFGLFPIGYGNALESRRETRAAYLAEQILADLRAASFYNARILVEDTSGELDALSPLDLSVSGRRVLACDSRNVILRDVEEAAYTSGAAAGDVEFLALIEVRPTGFQDLSEISVEVSAPSSSPLSGRSRHSFVTLIRARQ